MDVVTARVTALAEGTDASDPSALELLVLWLPPSVSRRSGLAAPDPETPDDEGVGGWVLSSSLLVSSR